MSPHSLEETASFKQRACERIDEMAPVLIDVSRQIWATPERAFHEDHAAALLVDLLSRSGYAVEPGAGGLATAFTARRSGAESGPVVGLFSVYDALPGLGHGCGHNLLAISGVGAGVGLPRWPASCLGSFRSTGHQRKRVRPARHSCSAKGCSRTWISPSSSTQRRPLMYSSGCAPARALSSPSRANTRAASNPELAIDALNGMIALFNKRQCHWEHPSRRWNTLVPDHGNRAVCRSGVRR